MNKQIQSDSDKPEFESQDAPLTDSQILALAGEGREFDMITMKPNNVIAFGRALLAQVKPKTDSVHLDNSLAGSLDGPTECKSVPANMKTWPKKIWLQHGDDSDSIPPFESLVETTWCQDNINSNDVEYIRADLCAPLSDSTGGKS